MNIYYYFYHEYPKCFVITAFEFRSAVKIIYENGLMLLTAVSIK